MRAASNPQNPRKPWGPDLLVAFLCGGFVAVMAGLSCAAVPLYSWFSGATGFGGTTRVATVTPMQHLAHRVTVRFDSNPEAGLPQSFRPQRTTIDLGRELVVTVYDRVANEAGHVTGYNIRPPTLGLYFERINCCCFTAQTMQPRESRDMALVCCVNPKLAGHSDQDGVSTITRAPARPAGGV